ncbi:MAG TPA: pyrroline-5-carboxylate reductase [bacterium]|nr:pyrroline-5-carboxylate reductase [bacterium]HPP29871.1 pyrroline-5-carboxylate reductase [bacterium]
MKKKGIGIIGCGNMGSILVDAVVSGGLYPPSSVYVSDIRKEKLDGLKKDFGIFPADNRTIAEKAEIVIIAVKPDKVKEVITEIKDTLTPASILISIAAGLSTVKIEKFIGKKPIPVIRVMPNINVKVKAGIIVYCTGRYGGKHCKIAEKLFSPLGIVFKLPEDKFDIITAISGSGPGFLFYIAECIKRICREKGLSESQSAIITRYLFYGSAKMLFETGAEPGKLKEMVTSPGGTTIAGLEAFEKGKFPSLLKKVIEKAEERSKQIRKKI